MMLHTTDPLAVALTRAIHTGDVAALRRLLAERPGLATARIGGGGSGGESRTPLHVLADWPGHVPHGPESVVALVAAGADVDARFHGPHRETPLHWAASNDDVAVLDALLDAGADIDADGGVIGNGTPLTDARIFGQWRTAHRLVERGATTTLYDEAALALTDRLAERYAADVPPTGDETDRAFWSACHGGRLTAASYLLDRGADLDRLPDWERLTPLDAAARAGAGDLVRWLRARGARTAVDLGPERSGWRCALDAGVQRCRTLVTQPAAPAVLLAGAVAVGALAAAGLLLRRRAVGR